MNLKVRIQSALVWTVMYLLSILPLRVARLLGKLTGLINYRLSSRACLVTRANLELCLPDLDEARKEKMVLSSLQHSAMTAFETPKVWLNSRESTRKRILKVEGGELLEEAMKGDKGLIILLPHLGNWEVYNVFIKRYGAMTALYQPPRKAYLARVMEKIRLGFGNEMVPANRSGVAQLYRRLKAGRVVSILPDQVPLQGEYIPFFGIAALTDTLTSRLLQKTGANVLSLHITRTMKPPGYEVNIKKLPESVYSPEIATSLRTINESMENCVKDAPDQYQWDYKRFRERPAGEKKIYRFNKAKAFH